MKILYADWGSVCSEDIMEVFRDMGHEASKVVITNSLIDAIVPEIYDAVDEELKKNKYDCVYSFNYVPAVSEACKAHDTIYICWVYDSPCQSLYFANILNENNYIFVFDSYSVEDLKKRGVKNIFYMPLGVNSKRLRKLQLNPKERMQLTTDISFVGSLYKKETLYYMELRKHADPKLMGYIDGVIDTQRGVYDYNFLEECLTDEIVQQLVDTIPCQISELSLITPRYLFSNYYLYRRIANLERIESLFRLSQKHKVYLYTTDPKVKIGKCITRGTVHYKDLAPKVFRASKINMNMSLRSIHTGMPLRALDIMSSGGFLLSNYQEDYLRHFEPGKEVILYQSQEEMQEKADFYLKHDIERKRILTTARDKVLEEFDYRILLQEIFKLAGLK